jgi:thiol:disulfide interchange protein DsbD
VIASRLALALVIATACSGRETTRVAWSPDEAHAFERARQDHKAVMLEFYASWCMPCEELDHRLRSQAIAAEIDKSFVPVKLDVTNATAENEALRERYGANTLPAVVFVSTTGSVLDRITAMPDDGELATIIHRAAAPR